MSLVTLIAHKLGVADDDEPTYVCICCGETFERDYRDCPQCGKPYVTRDE